MHLLRESSRWNWLVLSVLVSVASGCDTAARKQVAADQAAASQAAAAKAVLEDRLRAVTRESEARLVNARSEEERTRIRAEAAAARQGIQSAKAAHKRSAPMEAAKPAPMAVAEPAAMASPTPPPPDAYRSRGGNLADDPLDGLAMGAYASAPKAD